MPLMSDNLRDREWEERLAARIGTQRIGQPILAFSEVVSTNDVAKHFAEAGAPDGLAVVARNQTGGRGRQGRTWISFPDKAIHLSMVLRPPLTPKEVSWLGLATGVAAAETLSRLGIAEIAIKWPNDLLARGKKIAGILVEPRVGEAKLDFAVVGIGLNVRQQVDEWPAELRDRATSIAMQGVDVSIDDVLALLLDRMEEHDASLRAGRRAELLEQWKSFGGEARLPAID